MIDAHPETAKTFRARILELLFHRKTRPFAHHEHTELRDVLLVSATHVAPGTGGFLVAGSFLTPLGYQEMAALLVL